MRKRSLSRKIVLAYSLLATLAAGLLTTGSYWQLRTVQRQELRDRLLELLRLSAPQIDSDYLALTVTADSMKQPFYKINQERLQNIQRAVPSINRISVLRQQPDGQVVFVLDYSRSKRTTPVGEPLHHITPRLKAGIADLNQPIAEPDLLIDPNGIPVLYGYTPIKNQFGRMNGVLVIELNARSIIQSELQAGAIALWIFWVVLLVTLVVIWWLSQWLVIHPILRLNEASRQIASGQWNQRLPSDRADELGDLAASFNKMAKQLQESFFMLEQRVQERTAALQESEEKFRQLTENINQIFCIENTQGELLYTSPSYEKIWGQSVETLYQNPAAWLDAVYPEDRDRIITKLARLQAGDEGEVEYRIIRPDGDIRWIRDRAFPICNAQGNVYRIAGIAEDITERKQNDQEMRRSRDLFAAIFRESTDALILSDPISRRILDCNHRAVELFEASSKTELVGIEGHTLRKTPWSDADLVEVKKALQEQQILKQECEYKTYKNRYFWGSVALKPIQVAEQQMILVRITDITERKQVELSLQRQAEADQLLAATTQTINQSIRLEQVLEIGLEQIRQFLGCDRVLIIRIEMDFSGGSKLEAVSRSDLSLEQQDFQNPGFSPEWFESLRQGNLIVRSDIYAEDLPLWEIEFLAQAQIRADVVVPILQANQLWGMLIVHQCDQTRIWQSLEINLLKQLGLQIGTASQKSNLYTQLENQLAQKEVLLKEVHHRVKNNLQMISAMLWLQSEASNSPTVAAALSDTRNRLQAMSLIHETLYQYSDLGQIKFHDYIQRLANNILAAYSTCPDQIKLIFHLQPVIFDLETAISCGLLLNELITNAIKHGFPDQRRGEICIALEQTSYPELAASEAPQNKSLPSSKNPTRAIFRYILTVQDNGIGLPQTLNLKNLKSLGLKIVNDLALQLDGRLDVDCASGTLFRLTFTSTRILGATPDKP